MRKLAKPRLIADALDSALRSINKPNIVHLLRVEKEWEKIVGSQLASVSSPVKISRGKLVIGVVEPVWIDSMMYVKSQIIEKVNAKLAGEIVSSIQIVLNVEAKKIDINSGKKSGPQISNFDQNARETAEKALENLPDSKLRSTFKKIMLNSYIVQKGRAKPK